MTTWKPISGKEYPALLELNEDGSFSVSIFRSMEEQEAALQQIIDKQVRAAFPALPHFDLPVPTWAKLVGPCTLAVKLLTKKGVQWSEVEMEPMPHKHQRRKKRKHRKGKRKLLIETPIETDLYTEETLAKLFTDNPDRVELLPDGSQVITFGPDEFEIKENHPGEGP